MMDILPMSSGDLERGKGPKDENELTLVRLRRLSRTVMSKNERHRFEARKLCRSNIVSFLEGHLTHSSDRVRYLALELFCCTIPRLANKTDSLIRPILPKVFQCLGGGEARDMKLKAIHFLRGYFRHTKSLSSFVDNFVRLGIENADSEIQISCCHGLNIVFDQDIGSSLYSPLVASVSNLLVQKSQYCLIRAAYRALKHIHKTVGDDRFFDLLSLAYPEATETYKSLFTFEESDSFLATQDVGCSVLLAEYRTKRKNLKLSKDFGILDPFLLDQTYQTKNCERARFLASLVAVLKRTAWTREDLDPHILDFLKIIQSFVYDTNRLIQMSGFDILKEVINKMGFTLSSHVPFIVDILRCSLTSANSKIRSKVNKVLNKLMRNIHPMTILWELLSTQNVSLKEAVIILIQEKISCFPYYDFDMVALCNYLGHYLEDKNSKLAKTSRDCVILLLDTMRECPVYGLRTEAVRVLLRNYKFSRETLKDVGVLGDSDDDSRGFRSYSDDELTDLDSTSVPMGSTATGISLTDTRRTLSTAAKCTEVCSEFSLGKSCRTLCGDENPPEVAMPVSKDEECRTELDSQMSCRTLENSGKGSDVVLSANEASKDSFIECSETSSLKEPVLSSEVDVASSTYGTVKFEREKEEGVPKWQMDDSECKGISLEARQSPEIVATTSRGSLIQNHAAVSDESPSTAKGRKYFTRFCMKTDAANPDPLQDSEAGGDVPELQAKSDSRFVIESYERDGVMVDVMNKNIFNFNILQVEHESRGEFESTEDKARRTNPASNKTRASILQKEKLDTPCSKVRKNRIASSNENASSDLPCKLTGYDAKTKCQRFVDSNFGQGESILGNDESEVEKQDCDTPSARYLECLSSSEPNLITTSVISLQEAASDMEVAVCNVKNFDENDTPFMPKSRQLPRTPIMKKRGCSSEVQSDFTKKRNKSAPVNKKKTVIEKKKEETDGISKKIILHGTGSAAKHNVSSKWGGCQWRRDLEYAAKAAPCPWAEKFEKVVHAMKPFPSPDVAEVEMKKAVDDLFGTSWKGKEEAMLTVIRLAKHHPEVVQENTTKIVVALANEIKNFRQSVAGKAVLTTGHLYEKMGKTFESKLRIVVSSLLAKSGNRTLAAYFRLVIQSLVKITSSTSPHKAAMAFIHEGSRHANKAARETAAQFLTTLTEQMGAENSLAPSYSGQMLKCAAMFVGDSSALTRYCGKRMFKVFLKHPDFDKMKDHQLDINMAQSVAKTLEQIKAKGVAEEVLPIHIID